MSVSMAVACAPRESAESSTAVCFRISRRLLDRARPGRHPMLTMSLSQLTPRLSPLHRACLPATLLSLQVATFSHRHR